MSTDKQVPVKDQFTAQSTKVDKNRDDAHDAHDVHYDDLYARCRKSLDELNELEPLKKKKDITENKGDKNGI